MRKFHPSSPQPVLRFAITIAIVFAISLGGSFRRPVLAEPPQLAVEVQRLFDAHWDARSTRDQEAGDEHYRRTLRELLDWRYMYAQTLVQIAQYRSVNARETIRDLLKIRPDDWRLHRTNAWASLASRDYEGGLLALDGWVKALPAPNPPNDLDGRESAMDIGRMFGFLEAAVPKALDRGTLDRYLNRWNLAFAAERKAAFEEGRSRVKQQHAEILSLREKTVKVGKEKADKEKDDKLKGLDAQQADIARQQDQLQKNVGSLQDQLKAELLAIEKEDAPMRTAMVRLDAQADAMSRDLAIITSDIARLERRLNFEKDPVLRARIRSEIRRLDAIAIRRDAELLGVERELDLMGARRQTLLRRQQLAQRDLGGQIAKANDTSKDLLKLDRRLSSQRQRVLRSTPGTSGSARAMASRAGIIATYVTFPLVEEKQRLLKESAAAP